MSGTNGILEEKKRQTEEDHGAQKNVSQVKYLQLNGVKITEFREPSQKLSSKYS